MSLNFNVENLPVYYSIELPCFMKNNEQALECVGGLETVQEHLARDTNLFFRFPGENPLKPALEGTTKQRPTLLLKLVRKRNKKTNQIVSQQAFVVGNIKKTVVFENPADYQVSKLELDYFSFPSIIFFSRSLFQSQLNCPIM